MRGRPGLPWSRRARRRDKRLRGDLKTAAEFAGLEMSEYDVAFHIPYGPGIDARKIEKMVYQTDLGMNRYAQTVFLAPHVLKGHGPTYSVLSTRKTRDAGYTVTLPSLVQCRKPLRTAARYEACAHS